MIERVIVSGFGGQGILTLGKTLAQTAMDEGLETTYFPSYGAEVRGGTANCHVILSDEPIYSPRVEEADTLVMMNQPSYERFRPILKPGGILLLNTSMTEPRQELEDASPAREVSIPATRIANELGNVRVANTVMLAAFAEVRDGVPPEACWKALEASLSGRHKHLLDVNRQAFEQGRTAAAEIRRAWS